MSRIKAEDAIPTNLLRDAFIEKCNKGHLTPQIVAIRMDWYEQKKDYQSPDVQRVYRTLGMRDHQSGKNGAPYFRERVGTDTAAALCEAMGLDPVELGF